MKKKIIIGFGILGVGIAVLLTAFSLYMAHHRAEYRDVFDAGLFDFITIALFPGSIYLTPVRRDDPPQVQVIAHTVAILLNGGIYAGVGGWLRRLLG